MRFAYIDSKGKEIELDSVEALALRIELGAISEETKLYDVSQDRWAPAKEHPIFQSLSSGKPVEEAGEAAAAAPEPEEGGGPEAEATAPPGAKAGGPPKPKAGPPKAKAGPPKPKKKAPPPAEEGQEPEEAAGETAAAEAEAAEEEPELPDAASGFMGPEMEGATAEVHEPEVSGEVEPVSFADVMEDEEETAEEKEAAAEEEVAPDEAAAEAEEEAGDDVLDMELDLAEEVGEEEPEAEEAAEPEEEEAASFDLEGELELEEDEAPPAAPPTAEADADTEAEAEETAAGAGRGLDLEGALDWAGLDQGESAGEEAAPGAPERERADMFGPEGMEAEAEPADDEGLELEPAHAAARATAGPDAAPATEKEAAKKRKRSAAPRPAHWEGRSIGDEKSGGIGKILVLLVFLAALGGGGWYFFMGPGATQPEPEPELPPAPGLPAALVPTMNSLADPAMAALLERADSLWGAGGSPEAPGRSWLTGDYFAAASQYGHIEQYWRTMQELVADLRERDEELFREAMEAQLQEVVETGELSDEETGAILDRAEWEFMAATTLNDPYAPADSLSAAALQLHDLLLSREADILTEGEAGGGFGSADPILDVIVQDESLRTSMNARLDRVLRTLAETEAPTPVTTRGLLAALFEKVRAAAFP